MKNGYDQFFQKARQNAGVADKAPRVATHARQQVKKKSAGQPARSTSNDELAQLLRERVQTKRRPQKQAKPIAWKFVALSFIGLMIAAAGTVEIERVESWLKSIEISFVGGKAHAEEKPAAQASTSEAGAKGGGDQKPEGEVAKTADASHAEGAGKDKKKSDDSTKKNFTEEELNHFAKLNERKRELDAREEELTRLEAELQAQKEALEKRMQTLDKTRREISSVLEEKVKSDSARVETLVQVYSTMKPQQAAKIFEDMEEDLAVDILGRMKKKNAAEIMNLVKPEKAKSFSEKFAGYKRN